MWLQCRRCQNRIRLDERTISIASRSRPIDGQAARLARKAYALGQTRPKATLINGPDSFNGITKRVSVRVKLIKTKPKETQ